MESMKVFELRWRLTKISQPYRPFFVRSLDNNKRDHIQFLRLSQRSVRECCVFVFTESWLHNGIPDSAIQLEQLTCYQADRTLTEGGKTRGCGICVYIKNAWSRVSNVNE